MTREQITEFLRQRKTMNVKFAVTDLDGVLRGKMIHSDKFISGLDKGLGFCNVIFGWDSADELYDFEGYSGWHTGFPDSVCHIDLSTFRVVPWQDELPFFLADFSGATDGAQHVCPRSLLKRIAMQCREMGFHPEFAQEFEWYNFKESPSSLQEKKFNELRPLSPGMFGYSMLRPSQQSEFYLSLFQMLAAFNVAPEALHTETGPGVYEASIPHDQVINAADKAVLLKSSVKEIASRHGISASFMAKWDAALPGCSGHIHQSLWDIDKRVNLFHDDKEGGPMNGLMAHYLAGQLLCLPEIMPMYAPTVNSYKRLVKGSWAPVTQSWGYDNRTTAIRALLTDHDHTRLEMRVPGADSNPYLAMSAALASGLYGIKHSLALDVEETKGNAYAAASARRLPSNLRDATVAMKGSALAKELFGETFVEQFCNSRFWEWKQYSRQVTDWERRRYFEII